MHDIVIASSVFDKEKTKQYHLSIQSNLDGFSFCIYEPLSNKFILLSHKGMDETLSVNENFSRFINTEPLFKHSYRSVSMMYALNPSTPIPSPVFQEEDAATFYNLNYNLSETQSLRYDVIDNIDMMNVYAVENAMVEIMQNRFGEFSIRHLNTVKQLQSVSVAPGNAVSRVLLSVTSKDFFISAFKNNQLQLQNCFPYKNDDEFLYFFLYCFNQLQLDQHQTIVELEGCIPRHSSLINAVKKYINHVEPITWPASFNFSNEFYEHPAHCFNALFYLHLCE
jgi:hypothetical protein